MQAWGKNNANHYLIDQVRKRMDFPETIKTLRDFCSKHYGYEAVVIEDKANGPAIIDTIRQVIPAVVSCSPYGSKESRLSSVSPMIEAGNVHLPLISENPWVEDFLAEASTFPAGKYNDQVDTMSQALNWYRENESSIDHLIML
jgi:predicted phage terminase large subunit-like protein